MNSVATLVVIILSMSHSLTLISGNPEGVPDSACAWMSPWHQPYEKPQMSSPPYKLKVYHPDVFANMRVPMCVIGAEPFKGLMVQAHDMEGNVLGSWDIGESEILGTINCTNQDDTVTHASSKHKQIIPLKWIAPMDYEGQVVFKAAIVKSYSTFWTGITSDVFNVHRKANS